MSKKNLYLITLVVAVIVLVNLACSGTGELQEAVNDAQPKLADAINDGLHEAAESVSEAAENLSDATPGSGCLTYDLYESVTGKDIVDQSNCK